MVDDTVASEDLARAAREREEDELDQRNPADRIAPRLRELAPMRAAGHPRLAIVVGHTQRAGGAFGGQPIDQSEYPWNTELAERCQAFAETVNIDTAVFFRDGVGIPGAYSEAMRWRPHSVVELHFNANGGRARGSEVLHGTQVGSRDYAGHMQATFRSLYNRSTADGTDRGLLLRRPDSGERGAASVNAAPIPSILIEPFFGDNGDDAGKGHRLKGELAKAIVEAFRAFRSAQGDGPPMS